MLILMVSTVVFLAVTSGCGKGLPANPSVTDPAIQATPMQTATRVPTFTPSPVYPTPVYTIVPEFEGYYMGTVVISAYYTLLEKERYEDAYALLSTAEQSRSSLPAFEELQRKAETIAEIVTVQPVQAQRVQDHLPLRSEDTAKEITFFVKVRLVARGNMPSTAPSTKIQTQYLALTKEGDLWRIGPSSTSHDMPGATLAPPATIDPAFVYDVSYYDSLVAISQHYTLFNHGFYKDAYDLTSPHMPHRQSFEQWVSLIRSFQIEVNEIVAIYPEFESIRQSQIRPTPDPLNRRKFYADIYAQGANGMAGSVPNGVHTYFITTLLESGRWKIFSVNTSP